MDTPASEIIDRAVTLLEAAEFGPISKLTAEAYVRAAERVHAARVAAGSGWAGLDSLPGAQATHTVMRAAWARRTHREVASALDDMRNRRCTGIQGLARLLNWLPQAEACRPCPGHTPSGGQGPARAPSKSKRHSLGQLPADWLERLWDVAVDRRFKHLDALAVLIASGCRPAEVCYGAAVRLGSDLLEIALAGAKATADHGQPWRLVTVAMALSGPVAHLAALAADKPEGLARVRAHCTPAALSMAVTDLADELVLPHRVSPYDIRHQRCSDARIAFAGNSDLLAAWLGHSGTSSARHYGRLPQSAGVRGPIPLDASAAREIRHAVKRVVSLCMDEAGP